MINFFHKSCLGLGLALAHIAAYSDTVAVLFALEEDEAAIKAEASPIGNPVKVGGRNYQKHRLGGHTIISARMGSGAVETSLTAQALLTKFRCDLVISVGPAGALSSDLQVGKWYVASEMSPWQRSTARPNGIEFGKDAIWRDPSLGREFPLPLDSLGDLRRVRVASGEMFVASDSKRHEVFAMSGADAIEMNLFGLWAATRDHEVPLIALRVISDRAGDQADAEFKAFVASYRGEGGKAALEIVRKLPANPSSPDSYENLRNLSGNPDGSAPP